MRKRATHARRGDDFSRRALENPVARTVRGTIPTDLDPATPQRIQMPCHHGVGDHSDGHVAGTHVAPDAGLGRLVGRHRRVPIQMIRSEVQPRRRLGAERLDECEAEAGGLHHEHVDVHVECLHQRNVRVAARDRATTRCLDHRLDHRDGGGLAVRAGDGDHRTRSTGTRLLPLVGEVEFAVHGLALLTGESQDTVPLGNPGRRGDGVDSVQDRGQTTIVRRLDQLDTQSGHGSALRGRHVVVRGDHRIAASHEGLDGGRAGHADAVDENAFAHGNTFMAASLIRVKSAMNMAREPATQIPPMIQKRMITVVSGQPISSK
ncbi:unannotated protein [freshwater metagenome]|uniref:Unannotated protein n=1 Tax=freshwater metagenome TaxID=449393 RepID=A0A6J6FA60_9ZZZZ